MTWLDLITNLLPFLNTIAVAVLAGLHVKNAAAIAQVGTATITAAVNAAHANGLDAGVQIGEQAVAANAEAGQAIGLAVKGIALHGDGGRGGD